MLHIIASSMHREEQSLPFELPAGWADSNQCVAVLTGGTEASFVELVNDGKIDLQQPIYLLASGQSNSLAASLEILAWIQQHGGTGRVLTSAAQIAVEESSQPDTNTAVKKRNLHLFKTVNTGELRLGVIGEPSDWLIASLVDDRSIYRKTGIRLVRIPIEEVSSLGEVDGGLKGAEQIYDRLKKIVVRYGLGGLTLRCFDLLTTVKNTGCVALSHLNDEGIPAACEGDIPLLLTMLYAKQNYGKIGFQVNPARIGDDGRMLFAHCTVPLKMTTSHVIDTHFESGIGIGIHGELPLGRYRLLKLSRDLKQVLDEPVELVANQYEPNLCRTQVWLQGTPELARRLLTHPLANHHLLIKED